MNEAESLLGHLENVLKNNQYKQLSGILNVNPQYNPYIVKLYNSASIPKKHLDSMVEMHKYFGGDWGAFNEVVISFIQLSQEMNPWSAVESFDLYTKYLNDLAVAFSNSKRGGIIVDLLKSSVEEILPLATKLDIQLYYKEDCRQPRLTYIATILLKVFNNIRSQAGEEDQQLKLKKTILLFMGNKLCQVYFKIGNPLLCRNVFSNMNNANLQFSYFPPDQQVTYRYYLGRFYFIKNQFIDSYQHFEWCLNKMVHMQNHKNITQLLKYWIPAGIMLGKFMNLTQINLVFYNGQGPAFLSVYQKISDSIKQGNFQLFYSLLDENYSFLKQNQLLVALSSKCNLLILRNLIKKVWIITGRQPKLNFDDIKLALQLLIANSNKVLMYLDQDQTIENIFVSLIDQNLVKGKLFPRLRVVLLSKINVFPTVSEINFVKFGHGQEGRLSSGDKWMAA
ncbi:hypothetical protein HYPBUDRAFT_112074 [Hyphopichia burtonii NRRL Y-1933]|uniref:Uncharacterized protein n=1 Tax=Hyphopichia burtonii NRRL Y-1933 TaxID=984485 RepID=A0A1E4RFE2_9ASCO|nr:hypothetical protein HYPBUDRAFT_112074 [Hyphopichia burtonii NRRL Y-1933]ODV65963.1 hypothetical protein HYPBUDRAFT_112074 [Hyphopichia burtonii NRRL Y-1933]